MVSRRIGVGVLVLLAAIRAEARSQDLAADVKFLEDVKISTDNPGLLDYFRKRSLKKGDAEKISDLVKKLGSDSFAERERAKKEVVLWGPPALPFLQKALDTSDLEVIRRASDCMNLIEKANTPEYAATAARVLAQRRVKGGVEALLDYVAHVQNPHHQEDILVSLSKLAVTDGKIDPVLAKAMRDPMAKRRAGAVYAAARGCAVAHRESIREFLRDPSPLVRERTAEGLLGKSIFQSLAEGVSTDLDLLKTHKVASDPSSLREFLRKRTLNEKDQEQVRSWIHDLGADSFQTREKATRQLVAMGTTALNFLAETRNDAELEVRRRIGHIVEQIKRGPGPALPAAAVRLLARPNGDTPAAIRDLLAYAPFAEDPSVENELLNVLCVLGTREVKLDAALEKALQSKQAAMRAAAAYTLGKVGTAEYIPLLLKLLKDKSPEVRLRAAQGLLAAKEKAGVAALIKLFNDVKDEQVGLIEDTLYRLAGKESPTEVVSGTSKELRAKAEETWRKWLQASGDTLDFWRLADGEATLGLMTIVEYDGPTVPQRGFGKVWECGRDGKPRWSITNLSGPMDAHVLPNGRVLIAESNAQQVTERDLQGKVLWTYRTQGNPIACQRLPNGNTFVATFNHVIEVTPDGRELYKLNRGPQFYIFSAQKLRNGNVVAITAQGVIQEFDPMTNRDVRSIFMGRVGGWSGIHALPNGRYLVASSSSGQVVEIDSAGNQQPFCHYAGAFRVTRLPNGHTLVGSMSAKQIAEFDRAGHLLRVISCEGRPWSVKFR